MAFVKTREVKKEEDNTELFYLSEEITDMVICKSPEKLELLLRSIEKHKVVHYLSDGDWSMHDLVMILLRKYRPADLYITTYAIRETPMRQLIMAQERKDVLSVNMVMDYRAKTRTPEVFQLASSNVNKLVLTNIHAKVTVIKSPIGNISIAGSANWTSNPRIEYGTVSLDDWLANWHVKWIQKLLDNAEIFK